MKYPVTEILVDGELIDVKQGHVEPVDLDCDICGRNGVEHVVFSTKEGGIFDILDSRTYGRILVEKDEPLDADFTPLCTECKEKEFVEVGPSDGYVSEVE